MNKKRGSDQQSTDQIQDKQNEDKQAKDNLNETLRKLNDLEKNYVPDRIDNGQPVRPKEYREAQQIEKDYPSFFDEDSGNSDKKKQGYEELKEYLQSELDALPGTKESSGMEGSQDRDIKKQKPSTSDSSEGKEKPSSSGSSVSDNKDNKQTPSDFIDEKQATQMPDLWDADGGGD